MVKFINTYVCGFCTFSFEAVVGTSSGDKKTRVSSQVRCPACKNFVRTYDDAKTSKEIKKEMKEMKEDG